MARLHGLGPARLESAMSYRGSAERPQAASGAVSIENTLSHGSLNVTMRPC